MKKKLFGLIMIACMFVFPFLVSAEEGTGSTPLAKIGEKEYATLQEAVDAAENGTTPTTITILRDATNVPGIKVLESNPKNVIIDFAGHTIQLGVPLVGSPGTVSQNIHIERGSTFVLKNGTLKAAPEAAMLIQNYAKLTIKDMTIDATTSEREGAYAVSLNNDVVSIEGNTNIYSKYYALDVYWWPNMSYVDGTQVTINTTGKVEGTIIVSPDAGATLTDIKTTLTIENINHDGEMIIDESMKDKVTVKAGSYTDPEATEKLEESVQEGSEVYEVVDIETGESKYVVATEEELENKVFEDEESVMNAEEFEEALKELEESEYDEDKELLAELKKALEGKTTVSAHNILYGSFIEESLVVNSIQSELEKAVKVTLNVPKTLEKVKEGFNRKYSVIRLHWDEETQKMVIDVLDAKENKDGTVTFETDKFSTYILAYEDVKDTTNPNTFDGISPIMFVAGLSLVSLLAVALYAKNKKVFN